MRTVFENTHFHIVVSFGFSPNIATIKLRSSSDHIIMSDVTCKWSITSVLLARLARSPLIRFPESTSFLRPQ